MSLLDPRMWLAFALAIAAAFGAGYFKGNSSGKASVLAEWNAEKEAANESVRQREKARTIENQGVDRELQKAKARRAAADRVTNDRLRDLQAALSDSGDATTPSGANGTGGLERELLSHCAASLVELAQEAGRLEGKVVGLQNYINSVVLK